MNDYFSAERAKISVSIHKVQICLERKYIIYAVPFRPIGLD